MLARTLKFQVYVHIQVKLVFLTLLQIHSLRGSFNTLKSRQMSQFRYHYRKISRSNLIKSDPIVYQIGLGTHPIGLDMESFWEILQNLKSNLRISGLKIVRSLGIFKLKDQQNCITFDFVTHTEGSLLLL